MPGNVAGKRRTMQLGSKVGRIWLPSVNFQGLDVNTSKISLAQGTPTVEPTSGLSEIACIPMTTADEVHTILPLPWDYDRDFKMAGRIWFAHASTDASDAPVFKVGVLFYGKQASLVEMAGGADVVTSITHPGTVATDDSIEITNWTDLGWDGYVAAADVLAGISVELDALGSATADECEFLGLELAYQRNIAKAHFNSIAAFIRSNPL